MKKLKKYGLIAFLLIVLLLVGNLIFLKSVVNERHDLNNNYVSLFQEVSNLTQSESDNHRILFDEIRHVQNSSEKQFSETKSMKQNYDQILEEQKKARIDSVSKDSAVIEFMNTGDDFYKQKNYKEAFKNYDQALAFQPDNNELRLKRVETLYLSNPMDSSKYNDILTDIGILKKNGILNPQIIDMEDKIHREKGGFNE